MTIVLYCLTLLFLTLANISIHVSGCHIGKFAKSGWRIATIDYLLFGQLSQVRIYT